MLRRRRILRFISTSRANSANGMDPTFGKGSIGLCYDDKGDLYIGAKGLLGETSSSGVPSTSKRRRAETTKEQQRVLGTIAHELCHFVTQLTLHNDCKPYLSGDERTAKAFEKIVQDVQRMYKFLEEHKENFEEEIISTVFTEYESKDFHCEMIVRIPELFVFHANDPEKLNELRENFGEFFEFYETNFHQILIRELPNMEARKEVEEINEYCGICGKLEKFEISMTIDNLSMFEYEVENDDDEKIENVQILSSNCVKLTMKSIYEKSKLQLKSSATIFAKLETNKYG